MNDIEFPIRQDIAVLPADDAWKSESGNELERFIEDVHNRAFERKGHSLRFAIYEDIGAIFINDYALSKISISSEDLPIIGHREHVRKY